MFFQTPENSVPLTPHWSEVTPNETQLLHFLLDK